MRSLFLLTLAASSLLADGYLDTPLIPGTQWHVHDSTRPQPPRADKEKLKVTTTAAPAGAVVLFDGKDAAAEWQADNGA